MSRYLAPVAARYSSILVQLALMVIVTRVLSQNDAGRYFVIMGVVYATYFLAGFGLPDGIVRFAPAIAATGEEQGATALIARGFRYSLALVPIGAVISGLLIFLYTGGAFTAILTALWWAANGAIFVAGQTLVAQGRSSLGTALFYTAASVGHVVVSIPLILLAGLDRLDAVLGATTAGAAIAALGCLMVAGRSCGRPAPERGEVRRAWRQGTEIAAGRVVQSCLLWSPVWVAALLLSPADTATVGLASRLVAAVAAVIATVRFSVRPELARDAAREDWAAIESHSSRIAIFATALAVAAMVAFLLIGDRFVAEVFGTDYRGAAVITALMLIGTIGESFAGPVDEILRMAGHAREVLIAQTAALLAGITAQVIASLAGGLAALTVAYGLTFILLYATLDYRLRALHGIGVLPLPLLRRRTPMTTGK